MEQKGISLLRNSINFMRKEVYILFFIKLKLKLTIKIFYEILKYSIKY